MAIRYCQKLDYLATLCLVAENMGSTSTNLTQLASEAAKFGKITQNNGLCFKTYCNHVRLSQPTVVLKAFKIIQGHRFWYQ